MSVNVLDKRLCCGCSACANICPKKCIRMQSDICGFLYPIMDKNGCIGCGLCDKVCPAMNPINEEISPISVNAAWSKNRDLRYNSTSGGIFSELANHVVMRGGSVAGAAYGKYNIVEHQIANDIRGIELLRQSKYVQSDMGDIYVKVRLMLEKKTVLFCGTPCQVAALKKFLGKDSSKLITIDFICRGVNSPKAYQSWIRELESNYSARVKRIWFKYKENGWKKSPRCTRVDFENGTTIVQKGRENIFMCGYLEANLCIRPSCSECKFKGNYRCSDITLGDFWGIKESMDDDGGTSLLQINTQKGQQLVKDIHKKISIYECLFNDVRSGNICMYESVKINSKSEEFLRKLDGNIPFSKLVHKYSKRTLFKRIKSKFMRTIFKIRKISGRADGQL